MPAASPTPRNRRYRRVRREHEERERRVQQERVATVEVVDIARRIIQQFYHDVERASMVERVIRETRGALVVRYIIHRVLYAAEYRFVVLYGPQIPAELTRCETTKTRLVGFNARRATGRPVYILIREAFGIARRIIRAIRGAFGRILRVPVVSRLRRLVLRAWRLIDRDTLEREINMLDRKYVDSIAVVVFKLVDAFSAAARDRWSRLPAVAALVDENAVLEAVYARRGVMEDGVYRVVEHCSPYYLADKAPRIPRAFSFHARKALQYAVRDAVRRICGRDRWCREYRAMHMTDVVTACDAESRMVYGRCLAYALYIALNEYDRTWYADSEGAIRSNTR